MLSVWHFCSAPCRFSTTAYTKTTMQHGQHRPIAVPANQCKGVPLHHFRFSSVATATVATATVATAMVTIEDVAEEEDASRRRLAAQAQLMIVVSAVFLDYLDMLEKGLKNKLLYQKKKRGSTGPRCRRRRFDHHGAHGNIHRDHLGPDALFGSEVVVFFRLSRPRVQFILEAIGNSGDKFFTTFRKCKFGRKGPSLEAKVLLPLRVLAYGVAPHAFNDYYQMSVSMARMCVKKFNQKIVHLFKAEYLRSPTAADIKEITSLHKKVHGVDGMLGSMDCMHTYWKNCPKAWQGSFNGKAKGPTIVLEAVADHYLWFWHASYGYAGALNDLNILNKSPLMEAMTDGTFAAVEQESEVVPFAIGDQIFDKLYVLVDGIYPRYSRFVRGFKQPITDGESRFTGWQESARKDVERAFGVLQCKFKQAIANPIHTIDLHDITCMVECCLVLHNMAVSDRVMDGDVTRRYAPSSKNGARLLASDALRDLVAMERADAAATLPVIARRNRATAVSNVRDFDARLALTVTKRTGWQALKDPVEWARLQQALITLKEGEED
jgi:hypothetical protein